MQHGDELKSRANRRLALLLGVFVVLLYAVWPLLTLPDSSEFTLAKKPMGAWGLPAINTLILLSSAWTLTWAHWGLKSDDRRRLISWLTLTVLLGLSFLVCQAMEYVHAYDELNLKLSSGIYGTTFYMLTGFHGAHVTLGVTMLIVVLLRSLRGHFTRIAILRLKPWRGIGTL